MMLLDVTIQACTVRIFNSIIQILSYSPLGEKAVLYFFLRQRKISASPVAPMLSHAGPRSRRSMKEPSGLTDNPVMMVKTSDVANPTCSPAPNAATASADAVKTASKRKSQPKDVRKTY